MSVKKRGRGIKVAAASLAMLVVGSGAAFAVVKDGTNAGEVLRGTRYTDTIRAYGGADVVYGYGGADFLYGGNEAGWGDETDAYDGRKDTIVIRSGEGDVVYYDEGLDVLVAPASSGGSGHLTAGEAAEKDVELSAERPPQGLFEPHGKVLVEHEGERLLVPEGELGAHLGHGDEIIDPTGRAASAEEGRD